MLDVAPYPRFSDHEFGRRYWLIRESMAAADLAALVVYGARGSQAVSVQYLSNYLVSQRAHLVFPLDGEPTLFVQLYNHLPVASTLSVLADTRWGGPDSIAAVAAELTARGFGRRRIGLVGDLPFRDEWALRAHLPEVVLVDFTPSFLGQRLVKSDEEIAWLRRGAELSDRAAEALARELRPGIREDELPLIVESAYLGMGGVNEIHFMTTTPMSAPSACVPAQYQSKRVVEAGDVLITEISAQFWGYPGQVLRPYAVKLEPTPLYQQLYGVAVECFERIKRVLRDGATARQVVGAAQVVEEHGCTIYDDLLHGYGGGYLPPVLRTAATAHGPTPDFVFRENMTVVIQPNVITPDQQAGVQVGELVRITRDGCESLHQFPMQFSVCG